MTEIGRTLAVSNLDAQSASHRQAAEAEKLKKAAEGFEAFFLNKLMEGGRKASLGEDIFGSSAGNTSQSLLDQELTTKAASRSGIGIADALYKQFAPHISGAKS